MAVRLAIGARHRDIVRQLVAEGLVSAPPARRADGCWRNGASPRSWRSHRSRCRGARPSPWTAVSRPSRRPGVGVRRRRQSGAAPGRPRDRRSAPDSPGIRRRAGRTRGILVAAQLALSVVLLVGAGLMARAFVNLRAVSLGFDPRQAASMFVSLERPALTAAPSRRRARSGACSTNSSSIRRVTLSGVHAVGVGFPVPLSGIAMSQRVSLGPAMRERETSTASPL